MGSNFLYPNEETETQKRQLSCSKAQSVCLLASVSHAGQPHTSKKPLGCITPVWGFRPVTAASPPGVLLIGSRAAFAFLPQVSFLSLSLKWTSEAESDFYSDINHKGPLSPFNGRPDVGWVLIKPWACRLSVNICLLNLYHYYSCQ